MPSRPAHLPPPRPHQDQLYYAAQVRRRPTVLSKGQDQSCTAFRHQHGPRQQSRPGMPTRPLVVIWTTDIAPEPCCCRPQDSDIALSGSTSQVMFMASGATQVTHIRLVLTTSASPAPSFTEYTPFCFSFSPIYPTHPFSL